MSNAASVELLDLLRAALGDASDYRAAKELNVSSSAVSLWRSGKAHMSPETVLRACELAGIRDVFYWNFKIAAERETGKVQEHAHAMLGEIASMRRTGHAPAGGLLETLLGGPAPADRPSRKIARRSTKIAALMLAAGAGFVGLSASPTVQASAGGYQHSILCKRRRRDRNGFPPRPPRRHRRRRQHWDQITADIPLAA